MLVLNLSVEQGVILGVRFSPVLHEGCWVGEGETSNPQTLERFRRSPDIYILTAAPRIPVRVFPVVETPEVQESVVETPPPAVTSGWPEGFPANAVAPLEEAGWTLDDVRAASDAQLESLPKIGKATVKAIRAAL